MNAPHIPFDAIQVPLRLAEGGAIRLVGTRISLDLIVECYWNGMTPDEMVLAYDTLNSADVYAAIAFYLKNRAAIDEYIKRREEEADALQAAIEKERPRITLSELRARQEARAQKHVPPGE